MKGANRGERKVGLTKQHVPSLKEVLLRRELGSLADLELNKGKEKRKKLSTKRIKDALSVLD